MPSDRTWRLIAWLVIFSAAILIAAQWPALPYFLDSYYHLSVIQGFREAGGVVLHTFWEAAPEGRPHLYPPLFHLLWLPARTLHLPPILIARIWSWAGLPLLLCLAWHVLSRVTSARRAAVTLVALITPFCFFLGAANYPPANLVLAATLGILLALHRKRWLAGGILLSLAFWLHAGFPWLIALSLFLFGLMEPEFRKTAWAMIPVGILGASPWLIHLYRHLPSLHFYPRGEDRFMEISLTLIPLGLAGLWIGWFRRGIDRFPVALALGFLPMLTAGYLFRFVSTQGLFPWLLLAGITLDRLAERIRRPAVVLLGLAALGLASPTVAWTISDRSDPATSQGVRWGWADTTVPILAGRPQVISRGNAVSVYHERFMSELSELVRAHTTPEELVYCNLPYFSGMLSVLTGRAITNEMLREMTERPSETQIRLARLIVWVKHPSGQPLPGMEEAIQRFGLKQVGETDLACVLVNPASTGHRQKRKAVIPWWIAELAVGLMLVVLVWDLRRSG